jgi:methyltransferase (TIGR00027 family)
VHQILDRPPVLDDPLAIPILGAETAAALRADPTQFTPGPFAPVLRAFMAARARFAEDQLASLRAAGVQQYVVLGAGLDTFAYRDQSPLPLRIWEVDHPATQAWKRARLAEAEITVPPSLTFVPVDFERDALPDALRRAGFDPSDGAFFSWLGVTPYLTDAAIFDTLAYVASATTHRGGVVFDYALAPGLLSFGERFVFERLAARVRSAGEPWQSFFEPDDLAERLRSAGFQVAEDVSPDVLNARYYAHRTDGLRVGSLAHLMWAGTTQLGA